MTNPKDYEIKVGIKGFQYITWIYGDIPATEKERLDQFISNSYKKLNSKIKIYKKNIEYGGLLLFSPFGEYGRIANFFRRNKDSIEVKLTELKKIANGFDSSRLEIKAKDL